MTYNIEMEGTVRMTVELCAKNENEAQRIARDYFHEVLKPDSMAHEAEKSRDVTLDATFVELK